MLAVSNTSNFFQNFEWEFDDHPMETMMGATTEEQQALESLDFFDYPLLEDHDFDDVLGGSLPLSGAGSSGDDHDRDRQVLDKKRKNHNESERDRRKKINDLYSSLRSLLPASDNKKKISIPATVARVLKYIPELQNEVEDLTQQKQELLSKTSALEGADDEENKGKIQNSEEEKPRKKPRITKESKSSLSVCSISVEKVEEAEIAIHISSCQKMKPLSDVLLLLEKTAFLVMDVSCFQSFAGRTFYNLHLAIEGSKAIKYEGLKQKLSNLIEKHIQAVEELPDKQERKGSSSALAYRSHIDAAPNNSNNKLGVSGSRLTC